MSAHQLVNQTSGEFEYYTPPEITAAAREVMGGIDLDPASSDAANRLVQAKTYYTLQHNGLSRPWFGRVWMNHPFHRGEQPCPPDHSKCKKRGCITRGHHIGRAIPGNIEWVEKLIDSYERGQVREAICITFSSMSEGWMIPLLGYPQCFPHGRIHYQRADGSRADSATKGSVITYLGPDYRKFAAVFRRFGDIKIAI